MPGGFNCPWCRYYNASDAGRCGRCERWLPPPAIASLLRQAREIDLLATKTLAAMCFAVFALELAANRGGDLPIFTGMKQSTLIRFGALAGPSTGGDELAWTEPWRLLASCFVHMGLLHIAFNLLALADLGRIIERENGGQRLVISFVVTGILGFVVSTFWYQYTGQPYFTAGASGAVFGIDGVLLSQMMLRRDPRWKSLFVRTLIYSFLFYFALGTNQAAHMGGLAAGLLLGAAFHLESRPWKVAAFTVPLTVLCLVASPVSVALSAWSPLWRAVVEMEQQREIARDLIQDERTRALRGETARFGQPDDDEMVASDDEPPDGDDDPPSADTGASPGAGASPDRATPGETDAGADAAVDQPDEAAGSTSASADGGSSAQ